MPGLIVLGLNAYHGDASAALLVDGELVGAIEEERLNREKHSAGFPALAVQRLLQMAGLRSGASIDHVAISRDPRAHLLNKALHLAERALRSTATERALLFGRVRERLENRGRVGRTSQDLARALGLAPDALRAPLHAVEHHRAHLASAFFCSGMDDAAVLSLDGFGDFVSTMWGRGHDRHIEVLGEVGFPHSLGIVYTAVTQWLGFPKYGDEGKVMGLAAYGEPRHIDKLRRLVHLLPGGRFALDLRFFRHGREGVDMSWQHGAPRLGQLFSPALETLLGPARAPGSELSDHARDVAASLQVLLEEAVLHVCRGLHRATGARRLCLAGGVALNSVANGKILDHAEFRELFVQPAAGDNGTSLGAALWVQHQILGEPRKLVMAHAYTGPVYSEDDCRAALESGAPEWGPLTVERLDPAALVERAADAIARGEVIGWFQGRMEFGPRALGHRSILCDPRRAEMKDTLNRRIKHREPFRPFAPAILAEHTAAWFVRAAPSPAMLLVDTVRPERRAQIPAVTHEDGTGRLQTVERAHSPLFHALISAFHARTGVPVLLNTSFNEHEPIVCSPSDALRCFVKAHMDALALGPFWVRRAAANGRGG